MQVFDVALSAFVAQGECQCAYHQGAHDDSILSPYYQAARHVVTRLIPAREGGDGMDHLLTNLCWRGAKGGLGIPGACTVSVRLPMTQDRLWDIWMLFSQQP